jgi:hypothetical protein
MDDQSETAIRARQTTISQSQRGAADWMTERASQRRSEARISTWRVCVKRTLINDTTGCGFA